LPQPCTPSSSTTLRRVEPFDLVFAEEDGAALFHPAFQSGQSGDIGEGRGLVFEMQHAVAVQQIELQARQLRQVAHADGAVAEHQLPGDAARVRQLQPEQIAHDGLERDCVDLDAPAAVFARVLERGFTHQFAERGFVRQLQVHAHGMRFDLLGNLDADADQHQRVRRGVGAIDDLAHEAHRHRITQIAVEIAEQEDRAFALFLDELQRGRGFDRAERRFVQRHVEALQAVGQAPLVQRPPDLADDMAKAFDDPRLFGGIDGDDGMAGADQAGEVVEVGHGRTGKARPLLCPESSRLSKAGGRRTERG
jgi:hypothetical protein